ncbi:SUMF1/EgtB/PvdO family nonheme iron enzyme [Agrococcus sp. ARC_14]|uniref:formylglycine-generating enzyme family protein n=1 Tax=Agrococcus sp. ARC_14 TaxID=2919927 RepID=UPI001F0620D0|nr:formylglycine-generating enzyme family protein [Agrococcus sp. ARC_14]
MLPPEFVDIPGGTLHQRDARTGTERDVELRPFRLGSTTLARADGMPMHGIRWNDAIRLCNTMSADAGRTPVYDVTGAHVAWDASADGYRLPTEAEWEHACRASAATAAPAPLAAIAWTAGDGIDGPQPVAGKEPNALGLHDMLGNVWEWCWDYADPARYADYRSLRGGGWADRAFSVRASVRRGTAPDALLEDVGLRIAQGAVAEPGASAAQGWSAAADRERADIRGPLPVGWTPLRELLD